MSDSRLKEVVGFSKQPPKLIGNTEHGRKAGKALGQDRKVVYQRDRTLVLNSDIINDHPDVLEILERHEEITYELVEAFPQEIQNFFYNVFLDVRDKAKKEWIVLRPDIKDEEGRRCNLCNQPIIKVCVIKNIYNEKTLEIGKDCAKHYDMRSDDGTRVDELFKNQEEIKRFRVLDNRIPGIRGLVESWRKKLEEYPIIIPFTFEQPFIKNRQELDRLITMFLSGKIGKRVFPQIEALRDEQLALLEDIDRHVEENRNLEFAPNRDIRRWLKLNGMTDVLDMIKEDGMVAWRTAHRIKEPGFMALAAKNLKEFFEAINATIKLDEGNNRYKGYVVEFSRVSGAYLFCEHSDLLLDFGGLLFGKELDTSLNLESIVKISSVSRLSTNYRRKSAERIMQVLKTRQQSQGFRIQSYDYDDNEVILFDGTRGLYVIDKLESFIESFKDIAFGLKKPTVKGLERYTSNLSGQRYSLKELKEREAIREGFNKKEKKEERKDK